MSNETKINEIMSSDLHGLLKIQQLTNQYFNGLNRETRDVYRIISSIEELNAAMIKELATIRADQDFFAFSNSWNKLIDKKPEAFEIVVTRTDLGTMDLDWLEPIPGSAELCFCEGLGEAVYWMPLDVFLTSGPSVITTEFKVRLEKLTTVNAHSKARNRSATLK